MKLDPKPTLPVEAVVVIEVVAVVDLTAETLITIINL
jgi:hypothetical protein